MLYAVPFSWPRWLDHADDGAGSPFGPTLEDATSVAQFVVDWLVAAKTSAWSLDIDFVGVWKNPGRSFLADGDGQRLYVEQLAALLAAEQRAQLATRILCGDGDWSCATYANANRDTFLPLVGAFGAEGVSPGADAVALGNLTSGAVPLWSTGFQGVGIAVSASAIRLASMIANATVFGGITAMLAVPLASGSYYLAPRWNEGIVQASSPWSGHWYATSFAWTIAHTTRFVPVGWRVAAPNTGLAGDATGLLSGGGTFVFAWSPSAPDFSIVVAKDASATQGDGIVPELATFMLPPELAAAWANFVVTVVTTELKFDAGADGGPGNQTSFERSSVVVGADGSIAVTLWKHSLVTITSLPNADAAKGSYAMPPPPAAFPASFATTFDFVGEFPECNQDGPARFFADISGSFECVLDTDWGTPERVLRQATFERPISRWRDTRPLSIVGDAQWTDVDLRVTFLLPWSTDAALFGVRATSFNSSQTEVTLLNLPGVWVLVNTTGWLVAQGVSDAALAHPVFYRAHAPGARVAAGTWHSVRLVAHGAVLVVAIDGAVVGRIDVPFSAGFPTAGYVGIGTGDYEQFVLFNSLSVEAAATTCSGVAADGAQVFVEQCAAGSSGQTFDFVPSADRPPSGQLRLAAANPPLCVEQNATGSPTLFVFMRPCNASEPRQLWNIERTIEDGPFSSGPVTSVADNGVLDLYYSGASITDPNSPPPPPTDPSPSPIPLQYADDAPVGTYSRAGPHHPRPHCCTHPDPNGGISATRPSSLIYRHLRLFSTTKSGTYISDHHLFRPINDVSP